MENSNEIFFLFLRSSEIDRGVELHHTTLNVCNYLNVFNMYLLNFCVSCNNDTLKISIIILFHLITTYDLPKKMIS